MKTQTHQRVVGLRMWHVEKRYRKEEWRHHLERLKIKVRK
jgi:hypothetical protein